jgi:hypothetical protein
VGGDVGGLVHTVGGLVVGLLSYTPGDISIDNSTVFMLKFNGRSGFPIKISSPVPIFADLLRRYGKQEGEVGSSFIS